jgi:hypothetical protein
MSSSPTLWVHTWGGLAGQLSGLGTALWIRGALRRRVGIAFHEGGVTRRRWEIPDLCVGLPVRSISEPALEPGEVIAPRGRRWRVRLQGRVRRQLLAMESTMGLATVKEHLSRDDLLRTTARTRHLVGYPSDWSVIQDSVMDVRARIASSGRPNFLDGPGCQEWVAVHWRLGDYLTSREISSHHGVVCLESILGCIAALPSRWPVRLFSDSPELAHAQVLASKSSLAERIEVMPRSTIWNDLYQMSRARCFVGTNSGVSAWTALAVAQATGGRAFLPDRWLLADPGSNPDIALSSHYPVKLESSLRE